MKSAQVAVRGAAPSPGARRRSPPRAIRASGAGFTYAGRSRPAFQGLELDLEPGALLLVVGPSGSGKSTLARAVAGLLPDDFPGEWTGSLQVGDVDVSRGDAGAFDDEAAVEPPPVLDLDPGVVFQDPASQLVMERAGDDVAFGLENEGWDLDLMRQRVPWALADVGLGGFEDRRSNRLSGGEQQRLAIAGALAPGPGVLVLDEPTSNLDPDGARAVFGELAALRDRRSTTIVLVEHRASLAWPIADVVLALDDAGRPIDLGRPNEVLLRSAERLERAGIWLPEHAGARAPRAARTGDASATATRSRPAAVTRPASVPRPAPAPRPAGAQQFAGPIIEMDGVRFQFEAGAPVIRGVELSVEHGEHVALVGPNGSGKSTLLRLAMGLLRPSAGWVRLAGREPARLKPVQVARLAGYVVQDPELGFLSDSVAEEVVLGLDRASAAYAWELTERLGLTLDRFGNQSPYRLSGGEQRRLSLVTALARRPLLLALDEPTYGQDRRGHEALVAALDDLVGSGSAMLAATHDERFVRDAADRFIELAEGWIVADESLSRTRRAEA